MADVHESLLRSFRRTNLRGGFRETKSPMPTFRPDVFAEKVSSSGSVVEQVAVEAEISSTLFSEHTTHQLLLMDEFLRLQRAKRIRVRAFLLVPRKKAIGAHARSLLDSLFPGGTRIRLAEVAVG